MALYLAESKQVGATAALDKTNNLAENANCNMNCSENTESTEMMIMHRNGIITSNGNTTLVKAFVLA